jgi:NAD(P)-dependent dehydrogenase (short-subunit alcohol dehydrogenase family)
MSKKVVVVTGGAGGIGIAIGKAMHRDGWHVVLTDINPAGLESAASQVGEGTEVFVLDVANVSEVRACFAKIAEDFGRLDCLVNNAGVFRNEPLLDVEENTYDWLMDINLKGAFFCLQAAAKEMQRFDVSHGVIINIASAAGRGGRPTQTIYGLTKAGLIHLTKSAAQALAPKIRTVCICPAAVDTEMMTRNFAERKAVGGDSDVEAFKAKLLLQRLCTPEEVAELTAFVASDKAAYMTGGSIDISGGLEMH